MTDASSDIRPWLSVIIPSHCGEQWIDHSLRSITDEAAEGIEVLLIDSGETSAARDIAQNYSQTLRIRIFERRDLLSWNTKTNFGVEMAESDHISWLGVDDVWMPGRAAAARRWIKAAVEAPLHLAPAAVIDKYGRTLGVWRCPLPAERALQSSFLLERLCVQNFVAAPAPIFRKDAWLRCGGLDENLWYTADWDIWLKLAAHAPAYYHDEVTIGFRIHAGALTMTGSRDTVAFRLQMETVLDRHLPAIGPSVKGVERVARVARASITVNAALASASIGNFGGLFRAATQVALLGPSGLRTYLRDSRIIERVVPRVRARLNGSF
jgi:glycosyltransferase involved in cell wall biosynthesis